MFPRLIPLVLAFLLLGAHFLRDGNLVLVIVSLLIPWLLLIKKPWALLGVQWLTYLSALVWVRTAIVLVQQRMMMGAPWLRLSLILAGVALFTLYAGYLLNSKAVKKRYS